jgi:hypothetical protein
VLTVSHFLLEYPFHERQFPGALEVVNNVKDYAIPVVLSDGGVVFQPQPADRDSSVDAGSVTRRDCVAIPVETRTLLIFSSVPGTTCLRWPLITLRRTGSSKATDELRLRYLSTNDFNLANAWSHRPETNSRYSVISLNGRKSSSKRFSRPA